MLVKIVLSPSIFALSSEDKEASYSLVIGLLQSLEKNGVVLIDDVGSIRIDFSKKIQRWSKFNEFQTQAKKILKQLDKKNRLVKVPLKGGFLPQCKEQPCQSCIDIARNELPIAVLARHNCNFCTQSQLAMLSNLKVIDVDKYVLDEEFCSILNQRDRVFAHSECTQDKFEQEILIPLFRDAKHVKIYDRYIGRSILNKKNSEDYKLALEWILQVFMRESRKPGKFEVYGGTKNISFKNISNAKSAFVQLENDLQKIYPAFQLCIKSEDTKDLPHDRYLITNQVAVSVGRGFNLLLDKRSSPYPRRLEDVHINYCSDLGKIEQDVRRLPNLFS